MNVNQLQSFVQLQALKSLQTENSQETAQNETSAQTSFQAVLSEFLGGTDFTRLPLSISALTGQASSSLTNTNYARMNPYLAATESSSPLATDSLYGNASVSNLNTANGIGNVVNTTYTSPLSQKVSSASTKEINSIVTQMAQKYGVEEKLIHAVIQQESGYRTSAVSHAGALGLMQLMPSTAQSLGVKNALDPAQNIEGGTKYLKQMLNKYNGNVSLALAAYNAGSGNVDKYGGIPPFKETQNYVKKITAQYFA
ncbi:lytic transglycosylase domain-containing protein [Bacillus sp. NPDC077027]|uniref:lytic transglycosylase domain-containing protein n=1 Tax=Bacillus sp. NPDC077027 TaxID=3390548 RepID=UPI003CFE6C01